MARRGDLSCSSTQLNKDRGPNLGPSDSTVMPSAHTSAALVNTTHQKDSHGVSAGSLMNTGNSTNAEIIFNKTQTYWWGGKATRWRAATGASRHRAGIHRHWNWTGWGEKHR